MMASEDARAIDTPGLATGAEGDALEPDTASSCDGDLLATFGERLRPARRFYANPAGS